MAQKRLSTRYTGVYVRITTNPKRKHNGRPDRVFDFCYRDAEGKLRWEKAGWLSEGITAQIAYDLRNAKVSSIRKSKSVNKAATYEHYSSPAVIPQQQNLSPPPFFSIIAENYLKWLERESQYADRERFRYETHLKSVLGNLPLDEISIVGADELKHDLMSKLAVGTVTKCLNLCRAIFYYASKTGVYSGRNPFSSQGGFKMPRGATTCERFLTPDEANLLLEELAKRSPQLRDICYLSLHTGIRPCEAFSLRGGDLVPQAGFFWVNGKGGSREKVTANQEIMELLASYGRKPQEYIFQTKDGGKIKQTSDTLRRTVEDLGLVPRTVEKVGKKEVRIAMSPKEKKEHQRKKIWLHTFRHTYASWLALSGTVTLLELRTLLRHESTRMTERYAHLIPDNLEEQSSKINEILNTARVRSAPIHKKQ